MDTPRFDSKGNVLPENLRERGAVYYVVKEHLGRQKWITTGKRDFKAALRRYHEIMKDLNDGHWASKVPTLVDYWTKHYRPAYTVRKTPLKPRIPRLGSNPRPAGPLFRDDQLMFYPLKELGSYPLDSITRTMGQKWANKRRAMTYAKEQPKPDKPLPKRYPIQEGTVTRELGLLQAVFQKAIEDGLIEHNPWKGVEREDYATKERVLTEVEQGRLEAVLSPRYRRWLVFMLGSGLRLEEARRIDPERDVNFDSRFVRVTRKTRGLKKKIQDVPLLDPYLVEVLKEQLAADGGKLWPQDQSRFREVLNDATERAHIDHISPHTLRHTFATRFLKGGGNIYTLSKILGHSSVSVTEKVYAHLQSEDLLALASGVKLGLRPAKVLPFERKEAEK